MTHDYWWLGYVILAVVVCCGVLEWRVIVRSRKQAKKFMDEMIRDAISRPYKGP
jgi:hypothetical protein